VRQADLFEVADAPDARGLALALASAAGASRQVAMMAMTTSNSIKVNAANFLVFLFISNYI